MARGYRRKRFYPTLHRVLVHLSTLSGPSEPPGLVSFTQEGIGAATQSGRTTATKWLIRMERMGLITGERAHVPGHRIRKTVYRLTHEGWREAMRVRRRLETDTVEVIAQGLDPTAMRVAEIPEIFPSVTLTAAVSMIRAGHLDLTHVPGNGSAPVAPLLWGDTVRRLGRVFGRSGEIRALDAWMGSRARVLVVTGIAGIGKSTLVASWIVRQRPRPYIFWFEIHEGTSRTLFLRDLAVFLARIGRRGLLQALREHETIRPEVAMRILGMELRNVPILFVFDNFSRANASLARLLAGPMLELAESTPAKFILTSRTRPAWASRRKGGLKVEILPVSGLDLDASMSLLVAKGFAGDQLAISRAAQAAKGHPILLSFAAQTGSTVSGQVTRYFEREIWRTLSRAERTILEAASLFRGLVPMDALHCFSEGWQAAVFGLQAKNLLAPTITGGVVVHDAIRTWVQERIPEDRRRSFHGLAAAYFLDGVEMRDRLEGLYHLVECGDMKAVGDVFISMGGELPDSVPASELQAILRRLKADELDPLAACILTELLADAYRMLGHLRPAIAEYRLAIRLCEGNRRPERIPRLLRKIASIERSRNDYPKALGHLVEAHARLQNYPNLAESGEVLCELALLEEAQGRPEEAAAHMNEAVDAATEAANPGALARSLTALGLIEATRGRLEQALEFKREALRIAERAGNLAETARALISIGATCHELKRHEESLVSYHRALQLARLLGNLRLIAYATMNRGGVLMDLERDHEAAPDIDEAKRLFQVLEEPDSLAMMEIAIGERELVLRRWDRAVRHWDQGLRGLRDHGSKAQLARALFYVGRYHLMHGEGDRASSLLGEAQRIAAGLGNESMLKEIETLLRGSPTPSETVRSTRLGAEV